MDANLSRDKVAGFLGQSFVRIPRKVFTMLFHGKGREKTIGMAYLILISEVYFADGRVCLKRRSYTCKRGEYVGRGLFPDRRAARNGAHKFHEVSHRGCDRAGAGGKRRV